MRPFLSSNAQDFIEEYISPTGVLVVGLFLSSNAQDFIEDHGLRVRDDEPIIPEQ